MALDQSYTSENAAEREHLSSLANRLTDEELARPMDAGWTVSAVLAHMAFWDHRALVLIKKWEQEGIGPSPMDTDIVNEATRLLCLAIPPRTAAELAISCTQNIDQALERISPAMAAEMERIGKTVRLNRADHRRNHLGQIEKALGI
jgi:uncharacterized damage-inducible protein DinB